ncbi:conserved hypothetical protein [Frankia sp. Hr75.2]|nr:conserved hypothetical protein [Frankia sp. Hr75.2]
MDDSSSDIETRLPDLGVLRLDEVAATGNRTLRRVARRLAKEASRAGLPHAGFQSTATEFDEAGIPGNGILRNDLQTEGESSGFQRPAAGFTSSVIAAF